MRLINYGPGEISDRLTILALKILFGKEKGIAIEHFETERTALLSQIRSRTLNGMWFEKVLQLGAVNGALWQVEDQMRAYRTGSSGYLHSEQEVAACAFRMQDLNDQRAALVHAINQDAGEAVGVEKI